LEPNPSQSVVSNLFGRSVVRRKAVKGERGRRRLEGGKHPGRDQGEAVAFEDVVALSLPSRVGLGEGGERNAKGCRLP